MKNLFARPRLNILSQLFTNLAAGWFGVVLIIPGFTRLGNLNDIIWLTKNIMFGIVSLFIAIKLTERKRQ